MSTILAYIASMVLGIASTWAAMDAYAHRRYLAMTVWIVCWAAASMLAGLVITVAVRP